MLSDTLENQGATQFVTEKQKTPARNGKAFL
jgi:hypothetical protein